MKKLITAERVSTDHSDNYVLQRSLIAYVEAAKRIHGQVLEIGTGSGYGIELLAGKASTFITVDKFESGIDHKQFNNVFLHRTTVPPLNGFPSNYFDYVVSFQVIEHIEDDRFFLEEINRVLKPGGKVIITTPNRKLSLTRNPWHVREYTARELFARLQPHFENIQQLGVYGNVKVEEYYALNKAAVQRYKKLDVFGLEYRLPRRLLQFPYDLLNRWNRRRLAKNKVSATINMRDYFVDLASDACLDLFFVGAKK